MVFHWPASFCGSNNGVSVITIASNDGICMLDVVISDNKVTITGNMVLRWSCVEIPLLINRKCCVFYISSMLYSSNISLSDSSGKIPEYTLLLLWHYPSLKLPIWYIQIGRKKFQFWSFLGEHFTCSRVGETAWWGLSEAIKIPCKMWMALSVISDISGRCCATEWPREVIAWTLISVRRVEWFCQAPFTNC